MDDSARNDQVTYAPDRPSSRVVLRALGAMVAISVSLCVLAYLLLVLRESELRPGRRFPEKSSGAPRAVADIRTTPFELPAPVPGITERQQARLDSYGWVDPKRRMARIPIERAIEALVRQGGAR